MRTLAALMVFVTHLPLGVTEPWLAGLLQQGARGVNLFFVLSGFLITTLLLQEHHGRGQISLLDFYRRRVLRLFPLYYIFLAGVLLAPYWKGAVGVPYERFLLYYATYLGNWDRVFYGDATIQDFPSSGVLWSLGVEEQFYLLVPLCLTVAIPRKRTLQALGLAYALTLVYKVFVVHTYSDDALAYRTLRFSPFSTFDSILLGCLVGALTYSHREQAVRLGNRLGLRFVPFAMAAVVLLGAVYDRVGSIHFQLLGEQFENLVFALAIVTVCYSSLGSRPSSHPLLKASNSFGKVTYGFYLFHVPCITLVSGWALRPWAVGGLAFLLTTVVTLLSYRFVESPFLRLKKSYAR